MQRIVDIDAAMSARGWPARAAGRAELEVTDPVTGVERFVLEVESGSGAGHPRRERHDPVRHRRTLCVVLERAPRAGRGAPRFA